MVTQNYWTGTISQAVYPVNWLVNQSKFRSLGSVRTKPALTDVLAFSVLPARALHQPVQPRADVPRGRRAARHAADRPRPRHPRRRHPARPQGTDYFLQCGFGNPLLSTPLWPHGLTSYLNRVALKRKIIEVTAHVYRVRCASSSAPPSCSRRRGTRRRWPSWRSWRSSSPKSPPCISSWERWVLYFQAWVAWAHHSLAIDITLVTLSRPWMFVSKNLSPDDGIWYIILGGAGGLIYGFVEID